MIDASKGLRLLAGVGLTALSFALACRGAESRSELTDAGAAGDPCRKATTQPDLIRHEKAWISLSGKYGVDYGEAISDFDPVPPTMGSGPWDAVVQLVVAQPDESNEGACVVGTGEMGTLEHAGYPFCKDIWEGEHHQSRTMIPHSCSGVLLDGERVLTAGHCARIWAGEDDVQQLHVVRGRRVENEPVSRGFVHFDRSYPVKCVETFLCSTRACSESISNRGPDLMVLKLARPIPAVAKLKFVDSVTSELPVRALFHPLGMRMMQSNLLHPEDCDANTGLCRIRVDNGMGGSGGPLFTADGKLAGIIGGHLHDRLNPSMRCFDFLEHGRGQPFSVAARARSDRNRESKMKLHEITTNLKMCTNSKGEER